MKKSEVAKLELIKAEYQKIRNNAKLSVNPTSKELLSFYFNNFYKFILKETRIFVIREIYHNLELIKKEYDFDLNKHVLDRPTRHTFEKIANLIYRTAPDPSDAFYMMDQYLKLLVHYNDKLNNRILKEIVEIMFLVNKFTQLYYQGNGKGKITYVNLYEKSEQLSKN